MLDKMIIKAKLFHYRYLSPFIIGRTAFSLAAMRFKQSLEVN